MSSDVQDAPAPKEPDPLDPRRFNLVEQADEGRWIPDFLGAGFDQMTLPMPPDSHGESVATLVRHVPAEDPLMQSAAPAPHFALIAIHGWNDYFYQAHTAREIAAAGGVLYAIDLRRHGRSLRPGQMTGIIDSFERFDAEIEACIDALKTDGHGDLPLFLMGHSTGGLIACLWANRHSGRLAGLILNSPWLEFQSYRARSLGQRVVAGIAWLRPDSVIYHADSGNYQRVLTAWREGEPLHGARSEAEQTAGVSHLLCEDEDPAPGSAEFSGERTPNPFAPEGTDDPFWTTGWRPDPRFRVFPSWDAPAAWLSATLDGHDKVAAGLDITCPILAMTSTASCESDEWCEEYTRTDCVLNLREVWQRIGLLGRQVKLAKIDNAIHDILLSRREAREEAFAEIRDFVDSALAA